MPKTIEEARINFEGSLGTLPDRYKAGIGRADWAGRASSDQAEANYAAGTQKAISGKFRQLAVKKVSNSEWQDAAITKGGAVIGQRIRDNLDKWVSKFGPIYSLVLSDVAKLPPRTVDPMQNIDARSKGTVKAWLKHSGKG